MKVNVVFLLYRGEIRTTATLQGTWSQHTALVKVTDEILVSLGCVFAKTTNCQDKIMKYCNYYHHYRSHHHHHHRLHYQSLIIINFYTQK